VLKLPLMVPGARGVLTTWPVPPVIGCPGPLTTGNVPVSVPGVPENRPPCAGEPGAAPPTLHELLQLLPGAPSTEATE
jgi:hypothetical protein